MKRIRNDEKKVKEVKEVKEENQKKQDENNPLVPGMSDFVPLFSHRYQVSIVPSEGIISPE